MAAEIAFAELRTGDRVVAIDRRTVNPPHLVIAPPQRRRVQIAPPDGSVSVTCWLRAADVGILEVEEDPCPPTHQVFALPDPLVVYPPLVPNDNNLLLLAQLNPRQGCGDRGGSIKPWGTLDRPLRVGDVVLAPGSTFWQAGIVGGILPNGRVRVAYRTSDGAKCWLEAPLAEPGVPKFAVFMHAVTGVAWTRPVFDLPSEMESR